MAFLSAVGILAFWIALWGGVGYTLGGQYRARPWFGFWTGLFLGPLGWLLVLVIQDQRAKCRECGRALIPGARKCANCGAPVVSGGTDRSLR